MVHACHVRAGVSEWDSSESTGTGLQRQVGEDGEGPGRVGEGKEGKGRQGVETRTRTDRAKGAHAQQPILPISLFAHLNVVWVYDGSTHKLLRLLALRILAHGGHC